MNLDLDINMQSAVGVSVANLRLHFTVLVLALARMLIVYVVSMLYFKKHFQLMLNIMSYWSLRYT